jgi:hypothetical protein
MEGFVCLTMFCDCARRRCLRLRTTMLWLNRSACLHSNNFVGTMFCAARCGELGRRSRSRFVVRDSCLSSLPEFAPAAPDAAAAIPAYTSHTGGAAGVVSQSLNVHCRLCFCTEWSFRHWRPLQRSMCLTTRQTPASVSACIRCNHLLATAVSDSLCCVYSRGLRCSSRVSNGSKVQLRALSSDC